MKSILLKTAGNNRRANIINAIQQFNHRLSKEEFQEKAKRMAESAFRFYRGTNHIFWADFAGDWQLSRFGNQHTRLWVQGDAHIQNLGAFRTHRGEIVYGLNDFDDAIIADYQYDLWRMAISIALSADPLLDSKKRKKVVETFAESYLATLTNLDQNEEIYQHFFTKETTSGLLKKFLEKVERKESRQKMLKKWTKKNENGKRLFDLTNEKLAPATEAIKTEIKEAMAAYRQTITGTLNPSDEAFFHVKDIAVRIGAGTGSVGADRYYVLIEGHSSEDIDHILDVKQQGRPTPFLFLNDNEKAEYNENFQHDAERHAVAYKALSDDPDDYLGWMELSTGSFSVRERSPFKESFPEEELEHKSAFEEMAHTWGEVLATEHRRGARAYNQELAPQFFELQVSKLTANHEKEFRKLVGQIALNYATQVRTDYEYFIEYLSEQR